MSMFSDDFLETLHCKFATIATQKQCNLLEKVIDGP
jgi:hypothetical protein